MSVFVVTKITRVEGDMLVLAPPGQSENVVVDKARSNFVDFLQASEILEMPTTIAVSAPVLKDGRQWRVRIVAEFITAESPEQHVAV